MAIDKFGQYYDDGSKRIRLGDITGIHESWKKGDFNWESAEDGMASCIYKLPNDLRQYLHEGDLLIVSNGNMIIIGNQSTMTEPKLPWYKRWLKKLGFPIHQPTAEEIYGLREE